MSDDENDTSFLDEAWETLEKYTTKDDDGVVYDPEAIHLAENLYKAISSDMMEDPEWEAPEGPEYGWSIETVTLVRLYEDIASTIDKFRGKENKERHVKLLTADEVILFFTLADELLIGLSAQILDELIVPDERQCEASFEFMAGLSHNVQMDLLYYSGEIDDGLKGELTNIHRTRNKLIHDLRQRHFLEGLNDLESRVERTIDGINHLYEIAEDQKAFVSM